MKSYKLFTLLAVLVLPFKSGFAYECKKLKESLIGLEYKYQTAKLDDCTSKPKTRYCRKASDPDSQKSIYKAQLDYNKALAKVNILEGLIAVSSSVENSHKAMKMVEISDLANAKAYINHFLMNYDRAHILNQSMKPNANGDYFWENYQGNSYQYTYIFIKNKCVEKSFKNENICTELKARAKASNYDETELYKTLHGFVQADSKVNYQKQARDDNYKRYRKYLQFTSSKTTKPQDLSQLEKGTVGIPSEISKVHQLMSEIKKYEKNKDKKTGKKIVELSNQLENIQMNFADIQIQDPDVSKYITKTFEKNLTSVSAAAGILSGENNIKNNFKAVKKSLEIELNGKQRVLLEAHKTTLARLKNVCNIINNAEEIKACLKNVCGNSYPRNCPKNNKYLGVEQLFHDYKNYDEANQLRKANQAMLECMDIDNKTQLEGKIYKGKSIIEKKQICLDYNKNQLGDIIKSDQLEDAKKELVEAKRSLDFINQGNNIKEILAEKFITIKMLRSNHCINKESEISAGNLNSFCHIQLMNVHAKTALNLNSDVENVLLEYNSEQYQSFLHGRGKFAANQDGKTYFAKMVNDCKTNKNANSVCSYFLTENKKRQDKINEEAKRKRQKELITQDAFDEYDAEGESEELNYDDGPSGFSYAMGGLARGAVQNMPALFGYFQTRKMHEYQMNMWDNQINNHNYYWGSGAVHNTTNITVNYDNWNANQNVFNPADHKYFSPQSSLFYPNFAPSTLGPQNSSLYLPNSKSSGFNFGH